MRNRTLRFIVASFVLILTSAAHADSQTYKQEFASEVIAFANLNRIHLDRLHRDVHADCYIPVTIATVVLRDGSVKDASIVKSSTVPIVDKYFLYVIEQAAPYPPLTSHYDPVPEEVTVTHEFRLDVTLWGHDVASLQPCELLKPDDAQPD